MHVELTIPVCSEERDQLTSIPALRKFFNDVSLLMSGLVIAENSNRLGLSLVATGI